MENKTKIFWFALALLLIISIGATYYRIFVVRNYQIVSELDCDPETEKCFVYTCDPATEEDCDATDPNYYYKKISKNASQIAVCDPHTRDDCPELNCAPNEPKCSIEYCDVETATADEPCAELSTPVTTGETSTTTNETEAVSSSTEK